MFGWLKDSPDPRDYSAEMLPGLTGGSMLPDHIDLGAHVDSVRDQGPTDSCVAFAICNALRIRASIEGRPILFPSALHLYYAARALEGDGIVQDRGSYPRLALKALTQLGVCSEGRWPFDLRFVNQPVPWDCVQHAADARASAFYRINGDGEERLTMARRALSAGYPFVFGSKVDDAMRNAGTDPIPPARGTIHGRHMQCCIGVGPLGWLTLGSWGRSYGFGGFTWISHERMASADVDDVYAFTLAPRAVT